MLVFIGGFILTNHSPHNFKHTEKNELLVFLSTNKTKGWTTATLFKINVHTKHFEDLVKLNLFRLCGVGPKTTFLTNSQVIL